MSSIYNLTFDPGALRDLKKLKKSQPKIASQLLVRFENLARDPFGGKPLHGNKKGIYSLRHGDYRILYEICHTEKTVLVIAIGDRKEIYS